MRMEELIRKKQQGESLSTEEIGWMIRGYTADRIPDYQMSALCMAVWFQGMDERETYDLTIAMRDSGDVLELSALGGVKADKHSTGGVGDKTSLLLCPMLAACGVKMAKLSGRGLGHTGGTIDKLESFKGFSAEMTPAELVRCAEENGFAIGGQTGELCPADKKLYALRDVTGTVSSRPLIVSSILSKKLAGGADVIVLDVKTGSGAFMRSERDAFALAEAMTAVGKRAGKKVVALVTDMDEPLGNAVGNALEVKEAIAALKGEYAGDLTELCFAIGSLILREGGLAPDDEAARAMLRQTIADGSALSRFAGFIQSRGGEAAAVLDTSFLPEASVKRPVRAKTAGYVRRIDAEGVGLVSMRLGGGRQTKDSVIDLAVGVVLEKKVGDRVQIGEPIAVVHAETDQAAASAAEELWACYTLSPEKTERAPFIKGVVR